MEMPEGWEKLLEENHRIGAIELKHALKVFDAMNLMKEMAEALELNLRSGYQLEDGAYEATVKVLKKFREWR